MRSRLQLAAGALIAIVLTGCGGASSSNDSAPAFIKRVTVEFSRAQAGRLWDQLVPAEQAVVPRTLYVRCARNGFRVRSFKVLEKYDEPVSVLAHELPATAVSVQVTSDDGVTTATMHAVRVDGGWRWVLSPTDLTALRAGRCP